MLSQSLLRYALAIAITVTALLLMLALDPFIHLTQASFLLFFGAVTLTALYGGRNAGIVATFLSVIFANYFFLSPKYAWTIDVASNIRMLLFFMQGLVISCLVGILREAQEQAQKNLARLEASEAEIKKLNQELQYQVDELTLAERTIRASEERLRVALKNAPIAVFNQDRNLTYTWIYNSAFDRPLEEVLGKRDRDFLSPKETAILDRIKGQVLETGIGVREEVKLTIEGQTYYYNLTVEPLRNDRGIVIGVTCAAIDMTGHKQAEAELQKSEHRFRRLVESNMFGVAFGDVKGNIHYANDYFLNMVGYSREELLAGQVRWLEMTPPEWLYLDEAASQELQKTGVSTPFEKEYIRKDGSRVPILIGGTLLQQSDHQLQEIICFYLNLTEQKQSEEDLRQTLQKLNFHVENTPMAVIEWDRNLKVTRWSGAAERIFGWTSQEVLGRTLMDLQMVPEEDLEKVAAVSRQLVLGDEAYVFSYNRNYTKNGNLVHCEWHNSSLRDHQGQMLSVLSLVLDITDRKRVEAEREQLLERERTARAEAEAANRVKDEFLAVLSHELRSPLNPILGWSRLLQSKKLEATKVAEALKSIERNARLQAELIEDLLDVSRILRGKLSLKITPVNLTTTIQAAIDTVRLAAEAKSIQIISQFETHIGPIAGDSSRLQQIIWNLLSNAVKFTPEGGRVSVQLQRSGSRVCIIVSDTGQGIPADFLPHVFEYFRQADSTITRKFGGLGLGLAIVRHLVELHGGTIHVESPGEGQGATFTVQLPLMPSASLADGDGDRSKQLPSLKGIKVLVIDDETDARELMTFLLEQEMAIVTTATTAYEGLTVLSEFQPNILLSDIGMPDVDGYTFMQMVRSLPPEQGGSIPAIALTAYAGESDRLQALKVGFQKHIAKPIDPETLVKAISELIQVHRQG